MISTKFAILFEPQLYGHVFLTCPVCKHQYQIRHTFCCLSPYPITALQTGKCDICVGNGQEHNAILPEGFADCPKCGHKCRSIDDLDWVEHRQPYGSSRKHRRKVPHAATQHLPQACQVCGFAEELQIHHIDWNPNNNTADNLQALCQWCHTQAHKLGKPGFDRLQGIVDADPSKKAELRKTASRYCHNKLRISQAKLG